MRGKISSKEGSKYRVVFEDKENVVSPLILKADHVEDSATKPLSPGTSVIVDFPSPSMTDGVIIARY